MYILYFDCGTSRIRGYLVKGCNVISQGALNVGSKDVSACNDNTVLLKAMKEIMNKLCVSACIQDSEVSSVYASGMVTSPYGLMSVSHMNTPVNIASLRSNMVVLHEDKYLKKDVNLIRGVKTLDTPVSPGTIDVINNVRGEETEVFGLISQMPNDWKEEKVLIIIPGSHTHGLVVQDGSIIDILSTFSGEIFAALANHTILKGSVDDQGNAAVADDSLIEIANNYYRKYGFTRAIYIVHAAKVFDVYNNEKRRVLLSNIISAAVVDSFARQLSGKWTDVKKIIVYAQNNIAKDYSTLLSLNDDIENTKVEIVNRDEVNCSVKGIIELMESSNE